MAIAAEITVVETAAVITTVIRRAGAAAVTAIRTKAAAITAAAAIRPAIQRLRGATALLLLRATVLLQEADHLPARVQAAVAAAVLPGKRMRTHIIDKGELL